MYILTRHLCLQRFTTSTKYIIGLNQYHQKTGAIVGYPGFYHLNSKEKTQICICDDLNHSEKQLTLLHNLTCLNYKNQTHPLCPKKFNIHCPPYSHCKLTVMGHPSKRYQKKHDDPKCHEPAWRAWRRDPETPARLRESLLAVLKHMGMAFNNLKWRVCQIVGTSLPRP